MCKLVQKHASRLEKHFGRIAVGKRLLDMACAVEYADIAVSAAFGRDSVSILKSIIYLVHPGNAVLGRVIKDGKHLTGLFLDIGFRIGYYAVIDRGAGCSFRLVLKIYCTGIISFPRLRLVSLRAGAAGDHQYRQYY